MTFDFIADPETKIKILDYIFTETDLRVFDLSSPYGKEITEYNNTESIAKQFDLKNGDKFAVTFQLWSPRFGGKYLFRKIELDPKRCEGHTFRYSTDGWGLIQLYFGGIKHNTQSESHIGHFNEKSALKWENINTFNGKVSDWNWKEIQATSKALKTRIQRLLNENSTDAQ